MRPIIVTNRDCDSTQKTTKKLKKGAKSKDKKNFQSRDKVMKTVRYE